MQCPGLEPGSPAWKADILTARLTMQDWKSKADRNLNRCQPTLQYHAKDFQ